jgi:hypothetical protein
MADLLIGDMEDRHLEGRYVIVPERLTALSSQDRKRGK